MSVALDEALDEEFGSFPFRLTDLGKLAEILSGFGARVVGLDFLMNFRRHTKFSINYIESQFDGDATFGKTVTCRVPNDRGDLIKNLTLKVTLDDPSTVHEWCPSILSHLVESAELLIGGQSIQKITGEYIYIHQQLHNTDDDIDQTVYFLNGHGHTIAYTGDYTYFMDAFTCVICLMCLFTF